jgi:beta-1,4-mannosyltransferase
MTMTWWNDAKSYTIAAAVILSALTGLLLFCLPHAYSPPQSTSLRDQDFSDDQKKNASKSGYAWFRKYQDAQGRLRLNVSVQVVVLGDIGRSPRMQYHALSLANHGAKVDIVGYTGSEIHPDLLQNRLVDILPIRQFPLQAESRLWFLLLAPFKVLWQVGHLYYALAYTTKPSKWMLVQNPPSLPTLAVCQLVCFFRNTRLVIDWHNFGYSILALRLGPAHPLVRISEWYEGVLAARGVHTHFCVTQAMARVLGSKWNIHNAVPLHDRPADIYQPLTTPQRTALLRRLPATAGNVDDILSGHCRLLVSSTSWTPDEDFSILLDALVRYSNARDLDPALPTIIAIITGKGPQRDYYLSQIAWLTQTNRLQHVAVTTAWLPPEDYAALLGAADLGVSLHTSSSGVDLPMKVVDMFGTGLPVVGWADFEAWPELVQEGKNGRGFRSAEELAAILERLFGGDGGEMGTLREGAMGECRRRWDDEWDSVAGKVFEVDGEGEKCK